MLDFKYGRQVHLRHLLARWLRAAIDDERIRHHHFDVIVPVPLHRARERERGFNQAALLARRIGRRLAVPTRPRWLARIRPTRPQSELSAGERRANVRGAFRASRRVAGRHVLVVDDILTTGATVDACARALRDAGAQRVGVLTVARVLHAAV